MAKSAWKATRNETVSSGGVDVVLVAGQIYDDLPQDLIDTYSGEYGGLVEPTDEDYEALEAAEAEAQAAEKAAKKETKSGA